MSATLTSAPTSHPTAGAKVTQARLAKGEWIKLLTVRSQKITLLAAGAVTVLFGVIFSAAAGSGTVPVRPGQTSSDALTTALGAINLTQLFVGVLGVLVVAGEYSTGLIRSLFGAVGTRIGVLRAKALVVGGAVFAVMAVATTAAATLGQAVYTGKDATTPFSETLRPILGATVYLTGVALLGVALGFILHSTAGGIGTLVAGLFVVPTFTSLLPDSFADAVLKFLPSKAGDSMMSLAPDDKMLGVGAGFAVFAVWVVGLLITAAVLVRRRDA